MATMSPGRVVTGAGLGSPLRKAGAPSAGSSEVQTLTFGGTPTGGTFKLSLDGDTTAAISWSATNATLVSNIDAALEALPSVGTGNVATAVGTMTAGIGTITLTFGGALANALLNTVVVADNSLTGTAPTLAVAKTTPGVTATFRGAPVGALLTDTTNAILYQNTGTTSSPTWTKVGTES